MVTREKVLEHLKKVYDPELHVSVVDLGLIYDVKVKEKGIVNILMTLTFPGCPLGRIIKKEINDKLKGIRGVRKVNLKVTFDPPWDLSRVNDEVKAQLGIF